MRTHRIRPGRLGGAWIGVVLATSMGGGFNGPGRAAGADDAPPIARPVLPAEPNAGGMRPPGPAPAAPSIPEPSVPTPAVSGPRLSLSDAVSRGLVAVTGERPGSYQSVELVLTNKTDAPVLLDLSGNHLRPTTGDCQRLGLSHPVTPGERPTGAPPGTWPFALAPKETTRVRMKTCCMDSGRSCPREADRFVLASAPTPRAVEAALRWWVDHPTAPQGFVNAAIWQNDVTLLEQAYTPDGHGESPIQRAPKGRRIRSHGGIVYRLQDGALTSVDTEGVTRFHATWVRDVLPRPDGLYAIGVRDVSNELWRFAETGEPPWGRVLSLGRGVALDVMIPIGGGAFLVREGTGPLVVSRTAGGATTGVQIAMPTLDRLSVAPIDMAKGRFAVVSWQKGRPKPGSESVAPGGVSAASAKFTVYDLDARTGTLDVRKVFWNVREMVGGPGGIFALSHGGAPERLDGEKLRRIPCSEDFASIVLVGKTHLVLKDKSGALVGLDVTTGRTSPLPAEAASPKEDVLSIDPVTDDVVWVGAHDDLRWRFGMTGVEVIP